MRQNIYPVQIMRRRGKGGSGTAGQITADNARAMVRAWSGTIVRVIGSTGKANVSVHDLVLDGDILRPVIRIDIDTTLTRDFKNLSDIIIPVCSVAAFSGHNLDPGEGTISGTVKNVRRGSWSWSDGAFRNYSENGDIAISGKSSYSITDALLNISPGVCFYSGSSPYGTRGLWRTLLRSFDIDHYFTVRQEQGALISGNIYAGNIVINMTDDGKNLIDNSFTIYYIS